MAETNVQAQNHANLIWKIADLLRGPYQPNQYGDVPAEAWPGAGGSAGPAV